MAYLTIAQAAKAAKVNRGTIYQKVNAGELSASKETGKLLLDASELLRVYPNADVQQPKQQKQQQFEQNTTTQSTKITTENNKVVELLEKQVASLEKQLEATQEQLNKALDTLNTQAKALPKPDQEQVSISPKKKRFWLFKHD